MIVQENTTIGNREFIHTYSDLGKQIVQIETGNIYDDAYDVDRYTYKEVD